jgi:hypothetical protein
VKICSCPKRDLEREEKDTKLQKNSVFRRTKKCFSQDNHHSNHRRHHHHHHNNNNCAPPNKIIKIESTESESENVNNNAITYTLPVSKYYIF